DQVDTNTVVDDDIVLAVFRINLLPEVDTVFQAYTRQIGRSGKYRRCYRHKRYQNWGKTQLHANRYSLYDNHMRGDSTTMTFYATKLELQSIRGPRGSRTGANRPDRVGPVRPQAGRT